MSNTPLMGSSTKYRPEIDGLRALAVIGVLLFHIDLGFPGGFVGVDVFFVISGYLITRIILRDLREDKFSITDFWMRRIRRILPTSFIMVVTTLIVASFILTPQSYKELTEVAIAQAIAASNFIFAQQAGYFAQGSESSLLLHTWSLAVEEQFYIIFPLLVWLLWRLLNRRYLPTFIAAIALASLAWSCHLLPLNSKHTFFLLPSRAWELLAGALLATLGNLRAGTKLSEVFSALGLAMIGFPMFSYDNLTPFPAAHALLPVIGAVLFIFGNQERLTWTGRLMALKPIVFIGLISYSLYLWHWPLYVFSKYVILELTISHKLTLVLASLILAILSWRFIETPFKGKNHVTQLRTKISTFAVGGLAAASMIALPFLLAPSSTDDSIDEEMNLQLADITWRGIGHVNPAIKTSIATPENEKAKSAQGDLVWLSNDAPNPQLQTSPIGATDGDLDFMLWGDSHGMAVSQTVNTIAKQHGARGESIFTVAVQPVTGLFFHELTEPERDAMLQRHEAIVDRLIDKRIPNLILVGRWVASCVGFNEAEMVGCKPMFRLAPMVLDKVGTSPSNTISTGAMKRQLAAMCLRLEAAGTKVWIMRQVPETIHLNTAHLVATAKRFPALNKLSKFTITRAEHEERRKGANTVFDDLAAEVLDPSDRFFAEGNRLKIYDEQAYYSDDEHLTRAGSDYFLTPLFEQIFEQISSPASK